jgi:uncharacterized protein (TIGR02145 family)
LSSSSGEALKECTLGFNPANKFCYDGGVYDKCDGMEYNPTTHICEGDTYFPAKCNGVQYNPLKQRCEDNVIETKCGDSWYDASDDDLDCQNNIVVTKCGESWYDTSNDDLNCQSDIVVTKCGDSWYNFKTQFCQSENVMKDLCGTQTYLATEQCCGTNKYVTDTQFCDNRDSKIYKKVNIGSQIWMAENLNYNLSGSKCYNDNNDYCNIYGRLYYHATENLCPSDWQLPSSTEWNTLKNFIEDEKQCSDCDAKHLMAKAYRKYDGGIIDGWNNQGNDDSYGFAALPGGVYHYRITAGFYEVGAEGFWWSSNKDDYGVAYIKRIISGGSKSYWYNDNFYLVSDFSSAMLEDFLASVRCIYKPSTPW